MKSEKRENLSALFGERRREFNYSSSLNQGCTFLWCFRNCKWWKLNSWSNLIVNKWKTILCGSVGSIHAVTKVSTCVQNSFNWCELITYAILSVFVEIPSQFIFLFTNQWFAAQLLVKWGTIFVTEILDRLLCCYEVISPTLQYKCSLVLFWSQTLIL